MRTHFASDGKLANICELQNGVERNCKTFSGNYVMDSLWPRIALELKITGTATTSVTEQIHYENKTKSASISGSQSTITEPFYVDHAQTLYLDHELVAYAHASVISVDCASLQVFNPSGKSRYSDMICGSSGSNRAISVSSD